MNEKIESRKGTDTPAIAVFAMLALFLFWRARYGYCYEDEPFLLTLAQRLYKGDVLIVDEWHGCQNFGLLLLLSMPSIVCFSGQMTVYCCVSDMHTV